MCRSEVTQEPWRRDLLVDQQLRDREGDLAALADERAASPGPGVLQREHAGGAAAGAVDARLAAPAAGELGDGVGPPSRRPGRRGRPGPGPGPSAAVRARCRWR